MTVTVNNRDADKLRRLMKQVASATQPKDKQERDKRKLDQWVEAALNGWPLT